ncbi:MAG: cellulase family glycosylhydrolase [Prevotella sp.]|nr:cellulase family glycosylhydrolase [Prevotella sp.]
MKRLIYSFSAIWMLLAVMAVSACSDSNSSIYGSGEQRLTVTSLDTLAIESLDFGSSAASKMIGINSNADWDVEVSADWVTTSARAGYGYAYETRMSWLRIDVERNSGVPRTATVTIKSGGLSRVIAINQSGTNADDTFEKATEFIANVKLGYNLGNTLESNHDITDPSVQSWFNPTTVYDWETCWGQPRTTPEIINTIAERGFNLIRVPVTWFPHLDADDNVDEAWMNRVEEVVNYVLDAGCYCIINVHHDASEPDANRGDGAHWLVADLSQYETISPRFKHLWQQIAERFRDYGDRLLFEGINEIIDETGNWGNPANADAYTAVNRLMQDFVDVVRSTGGNNAFRNLVVNTYSAGHTQAKLNGFQAPSDQIPDHLLASIHSYDPYNFCNDNGEWNVLAFDKSCTDEIDEMFTMIDKRFRQELDLPYFYGEFGALDEGKSMAERVKYATYMAQKFKAYNTVGLWWMGLLKRNTLEWYEDDIVTALFDNI